MKTIEKIIAELENKSYFIDTHCHLDMDAYTDELDALLHNAERSRVSQIISIGISLESSRQAVELAKKHKQVSATIGVHPHDVGRMNDTVYKNLISLYANYGKYIVGYGEIGLDYVKKYADPAQQREHFTRQLALAKELRLPVIVHNREADSDTIRLLKQAKSLDYGGVMHCFSGDYAFAKKVIDLGMLISIPGIVTFKNASTLQDVVKKVPLSSIVIETDGPFLSPQPHRGKRNEPSYLVYVAAKIAELRKTSIDMIARHTSENARRLFNLNP